MLCAAKNMEAVLMTFLANCGDAKYAARECSRQEKPHFRCSSNFKGAGRSVFGKLRVLAPCRVGLPGICLEEQLPLPWLSFVCADDGIAPGAQRCGKRWLNFVDFDHRIPGDRLANIAAVLQWQVKCFAQPWQGKLRLMEALQA